MVKEKLYRSDAIIYPQMSLELTVVWILIVSLKYQILVQDKQSEHNPDWQNRERLGKIKIVNSLKHRQQSQSK